jgi:hypothetical protein
MSRSKGLKSKSRIPRDLYETPQWCIHLLGNALYDILGTNAMHRATYLCDIGAGDGRIGKTCKKRLQPIVKVSCLFVDIIKPKNKIDGVFIEKDFLNIRLDKIFRNDYMLKLFVSNPPFSQADKMVFKTVNYLKEQPQGGLAAFLLRLNWLGSLKRTPWLQKNPPDKLLIMTPRPSFTGKGTDATEYAWLIWGVNMQVGQAINIVTKGE